MNRREKDVVTKKAVLERDGWRVFLGYQEIEPYIRKFEDLRPAAHRKRSGP
jgi:hypothetical protein